MRHRKSYVRDSWRFIEKIDNIGTVAENTMLIMANVAGLYQNIHCCQGLINLGKHLIMVNNASTKDFIGIIKFAFLGYNVFDNR